MPKIVLRKRAEKKPVLVGKDPYGECVRKATDAAEIARIAMIAKDC